MLRIINRSLPHGKNYSLNIQKEEIIFLQGPNGSGKSLVLKSVANLIPGTSAEFVFNDKILSDWDYAEFRSQVMYAPTLSYFPIDGVTEDFLAVPFGLKIHQGKAPSFDTHAWLKKWNMCGLPLQQLSSGQKQVLGLLRILSLDPKLLLLDEPTSHLDAKRTADVESLILDWMKRSRGSLVIVAHDLSWPERMEGKILKIEEIWD